MWARAPAFLLTAVSRNRSSVGNKIGFPSCVPSPIPSLGSEALPITGGADQLRSCGLVLAGRLRNRVLLGQPGLLEVEGEGWFPPQREDLIKAGVLSWGPLGQGGELLL